MAQKKQEEEEKKKKGRPRGTTQRPKAEEAKKDKRKRPKGNEIDDDASEAQGPLKKRARTTNTKEPAGAQGKRSGKTPRNVSNARKAAQEKAALKKAARKEAADRQKAAKKEDKEKKRVAEEAKANRNRTRQAGTAESRAAKRAAYELSKPATKEEKSKRGTNKRRRSDSEEEDEPQELDGIATKKQKYDVDSAERTKDDVQDNEEQHVVDKAAPKGKEHDSQTPQAQGQGDGSHDLSREAKTNPISQESSKKTLPPEVNPTDTRKETPRPENAASDADHELGGPAESQQESQRQDEDTPKSQPDPIQSEPQIKGDFTDRELQESVRSQDESQNQTAQAIHKEQRDAMKDAAGKVDEQGGDTQGPTEPQHDTQDQDAKDSTGDQNNQTQDLAKTIDDSTDAAQTTQFPQDSQKSGGPQKEAQDPNADDVSETQQDGVQDTTGKIDEPAKGQRTPSPIHKLPHPPTSQQDVHDPDAKDAPENQQNQGESAEAKDGVEKLKSPQPTEKPTQPIPKSKHQNAKPALEDHQVPKDAKHKGKATEDDPQIISSSSPLSTQEQTQPTQHNQDDPPLESQDDLEARLSSWMEAYRGARDVCQTRGPNISPETPNHREPPPVRINTELTREQVFLAIASLWHALLLEGPPHNFALGPLKTFKGQDFFGPQATTLLMPLSIPVPHLGRGREQFVVVFVRFNQAIRQFTDFEVFDSLDATDDVDQTSSIVTAAIRIMRRVDPSLNRDHRDERITSLRRPLVIQQSTQVGVSGIHAILNAWARMLNINVDYGDQAGQRLNLENRSTYEHAIEMINLATRGELNLFTIESFLHAHAFTGDVPSYEQRAPSLHDDPETIASPRTCFMNDHTLNEITSIFHNWRLQQAITQGRPEQTCQVNPPPAKVKPPPVDTNMDRWYEEYQQGLVRASQIAASTVRHDPVQLPAHIVREPSWLDQDDFTLGIASIWYPVAAKAQAYTFGTPTVFSMVSEEGDRRFDPALVRLFQDESQTFLVPFVIHEHIILAVATKLFENPNRLRIEYYDSLVAHLDHLKTQAIVLSFLRRSGWLGKFPYRRAIHHWPRVRQQGNESNSCGIHTILNAWAYMLRITIPVNDRRVMTRDVYGRAMTLINLALRGRADYRLIMAFLQYYRFVSTEDWRAWSDAIHHRETNRNPSTADTSRLALDRLRSKKMNVGILNDSDNFIHQDSVQPTNSP